MTDLIELPVAVELVAGRPGPRLMAAGAEGRGTGAVCARWGIRDRQHRVLDAGEKDQSRVRDCDAAANLAVLHRVALNPVRAELSCTGSLKGKPETAAWNDVFAPPRSLMHWARGRSCGFEGGTRTSAGCGSRRARIRRRAGRSRRRWESRR